MNFLRILPTLHMSLGTWKIARSHRMGGLQAIVVQLNERYGGGCVTYRCRCRCRPDLGVDHGGRG